MSTTLTKSVIPPLFAHQKASVKFLATRNRVFDASDAGCVSADTEFLSEVGWKRIDQYQQGERVGQFYPDTREVELVKPIAYVKNPCTTMIAIAPVRGTSQRLSHEHRVLYYLPNGSYDTCSAAEFAQLGQAGHHKRKFCTTFSVRSSNGLNLTDLQLRVMVAVIADGHFPHNSTRCTIRVKKTRKIERLRYLLACAQIETDERSCGGRPDFQVFKFAAPWRCKDFGLIWWTATQQQLEIIADELPYWDSAEDKRPSAGTRFSTFLKNSADFAQFAFSAAKRPSSLTSSYRDRTDEGRGIMVEYIAHARAEDCFVGPGRQESIYEVPNPEGFKYCFEVPTSFLLLRHNGYIFATGNTGKTPVHVTDSAARRRKGSGCILVLCPKSLIRSAWGNDFHTFAPDMKVSMAYADNRIEAFEEEADVYITNIDAAIWLAGQKESFWKKFAGGVFINDEHTSVKHATSKRSRAVAKIVKRFEVRRGLTGTPTSNGITDIWHQMYVLDDGKRLGQSFFGFRSATQTPTQVGPSAQMVKWVDKPDIEITVGSLIQDMVIRNKFEDCVDIPANHQYAIEYDLSPKHRKLYAALEKDSSLVFKSKSITAINGAVLYSKLLQCASGASYSDQEEYALLDTGRAELIMDLVEARKHSIVFFNWRHQRDELVKLAQAAKYTYAIIDGETTKKGEREQIVADYQRGAYKVLFAHPQSAGHGLTLTKGTTTIFASPTPNLEHYLQAYKRIYRISQTLKTETIMIIAKNTIDEQVWAALQAKNVKQLELLEYLREAA